MKAVELASSAAQILTELNASMTEWIGLLEQHNVESLDDAEAIGKTTRIVMLAAMSVTLTLCGVLAVVLPRSIAVPVAKVKAVPDAVATGDLTVSLPHVNTGDEIQDLNESTGRMPENLAKLVRNMRHESENVAAASDELSASAAVEEVSASTEEVSASIEEMSASSAALAEMARRLDKPAAEFKV